MATIKEIANSAGVSIGTVDRVLHDRGRVSEDTRERILRIVRKTGYRRNLFASNLANSKKAYVFAVLMPGKKQDCGYWTLVEDGIEKAVSELEGFNVKVRYVFFDRFSKNSYREAFLSLRNMDVNGVFIAPVISDVANECFEEYPLNIPFILFDSCLENSTQFSFIGQDSFKGGLLGGRLLHILVKKGEVAITRMLPEGHHINSRVAGCESYLRNMPDISVRVFDIPHQDGEKEISSACRGMLEECGDLRGVFVTNAYTYAFASNLKELCDARKIHVVGFDLVEQNRRGLESGDIDFILSQNPEGQGYQGINSLYRHVVLGESCSERRMMPIDIIAKENLPEWSEND